MDIIKMSQDKLENLIKHNSDIIAKCEAVLADAPEDQAQTQRELMEIIKKSYFKNEKGDDQ